MKASLRLMTVLALLGAGAMVAAQARLSWSRLPALKTFSEGLAP